MNLIKTDHLIVGAGPGGLAMAAHFAKEGFAYELIEKSDEIAHRWRHHYDRLHLHTVKEFSALPFKSFPSNYPTYIAKDDLVNYYESYSMEFGIKVNYGIALERIERKDNYWNVHCSGGKTFQTKNVILATGVNRKPNFPSKSKINQFQKEILHSRFYKNSNGFRDKKVLIIGFGNTGAEIALDLAEHGIDVSISVRSPVIIVPRDVLGRPVQVTAKTLERLPYPLGDWIGTQVRKLILGDLSKYGIPISKDYPIDYLKKTGKTPVIDLGTIAMIKKGEIKILPDIETLKTNEVLFVNGDSLNFDTIILCTGYKSGLEDFFNSENQCLDSKGIPKGPIGIGENEGLYFIGYDIRSLGGILGTIPRDAKIIIDHIINKSKKSNDKD